MPGYRSELVVAVWVTKATLQLTSTSSLATLSPGPLETSSHPSNASTSPWFTVNEELLKLLSTHHKRASINKSNSLKTKNKKRLGPGHGWVLSKCFICTNEFSPHNSLTRELWSSPSFYKGEK